MKDASPTPTDRHIDPKERGTALHGENVVNNLGLSLKPTIFRALA